MDFRLESYDFELPESSIAQKPSDRRDNSRLLVFERETGAIRLARFADILDYLPENCLLVANNSKVIPARVMGRRKSGGRVEFLLLTPLPLIEPEVLPDGRFRAKVEGLLRSSKLVKENEEVELAPGFSLILTKREAFGRCGVTLTWAGNLAELFQKYGSLPLPPYIRREAGGEDGVRYQTCYASAEKAGSVAAPTAGLHFTPELRAGVEASGRGWAEVTLYVGYGTFSPVRSEDIREHAMHAEYIEVSPEAAGAVNLARAEGRAVVCVGTTAARTLEGAFRAQRQKKPVAGQPGGMVATSPRPDKEQPDEKKTAFEDGVLLPFSGWTDIFLYPGEPFALADSLITNFHLPRSSLLMLVSAFAGRERTLDAYNRALAEGFRFFSYGDSMLIL